MALFSNKELDKVLARVSRQEHERDSLTVLTKAIQHQKNSQQTEQAVKQNQVVETAL